MKTPNKQNNDPVTRARGVENADDAVIIYALICHVRI